ncbi:MAG: hypothetical protein CFE26_28040 [Verrucomicrobiales bacterium VVV1]|nr:MAG: hypothetical protein CFE26_28040 [Verrucomicrobiales bacterium VVV1]
MTDHFEWISSMAAKKKATKGKRYTEAEKAEIIQLVESHGRGGGTAAAKKFGVSPLTVSNWKKAAAGGSVKSPKSSKSTGTIERDDVLRTLALKGFKIVRLVNSLTGEVMEDKIDPKIEKLALDFGGVKRKADDATTYVTQTEGQILVTMTLDRLLAITGTKA